MDRTFTRTFLSRAAMTLLLAVVTTATAWAQEAIDGLTYNSTGGYYEINDEQDLIDLATYVNAGNNASGKTFKQTQPITMTGMGFTPIGNSNAFKGTYDGGNHPITGLKASNEWENTGFIGKMNGGTLKNIILVNLAELAKLELYYMSSREPPATAPHTRDGKKGLTKLGSASPRS